jgi:hypothetical protein
VPAPSFRLVRAAVFVLIGTVWSPAPALAQESRAAQIEAEQAEKATRLHPYEPTRAEDVIVRAGRALSGQPIGFYPWLGSIFSGGLFSFGPGYRLPYGAGGALDAQAAISIRGFRLARATLFLPPMADRRVRVAVRAQVIDAGSASFYGVGNETPSDARSAFLFRPASVGAQVTAAPVEQIEVGASVDRVAIETGPGRRGTSIEQRFAPGSVPGLSASPTYAVTRLHAAYDWRDSPAYSRHGGYYRLDWSDYSERTDGGLSFQRVDVDLRQMIPILRENWVIALRATASTTSAEAGQEVPFFLMPQLGGGSDLRGYPSWRFRDRHRVLFSAEYRWTPSHFIDMAIFHDAGKVTASRSQLGFGGLKHTTGLGIRLHSPQATFIRLEVGRGAEGLGLIMAFGQSF